MSAAARQEHLFAVRKLIKFMNNKETKESMQPQSLKDRLYIATFTENSVEAARCYGIGLELNHTCISENLDDAPEVRQSLLAQMASDIEKSGTQNLFMHGPFTEIYPAAIDPRAREFGRKRLDQAFEAARSLNIHNMVVHNGWLPFIYFKEWQAEKGSEFWMDYIEDKPADFRIYVENVLEDEPYMMADMMKKIDDPRIRLCLDVGHAHAVTSADIPVETWIEVLSPWLGHFHLHNNDGTGDQHNIFAEGTMDMDKILRTIRANCSKDVTFTIEAREAVACTEWLKIHGWL